MLSALLQFVNNFNLQQFGKAFLEVSERAQILG